MSTKLTPESLVKILARPFKRRDGLAIVELTVDERDDLVAHCTALEEELKAAQAGLEYVKGMNRHLSNNDAAKAIQLFRAKLVEAVRERERYFESESNNAATEARQTRASARSWMAAEIIQLISTFKAGEVK